MKISLKQAKPITMATMQTFYICLLTTVEPHKLAEIFTWYQGNTATLTI